MDHSIDNNNSSQFTEPDKPKLNTISSGSGQRKKAQPNITIDLFPAALRAIEEDDLDKMKTLFQLENFNKDHLDSLVYKACERSKDITIEEEIVKNSFSAVDPEEEQSMMSVCQTARKNNEQLLDLLIQAESRIEAQAAAGQPETSQDKHQSNEQTLVTPPTPVLKSVEKNHKFMTTPELPKFKSTTSRELRY